MLHSQDKQATSLQKVFTFNGTIDVQVAMINGLPHFVATDVCHVLQLQNTTDILQKTLEKDEHLPYTVYRPGQQRTVNVVNESGLYALIFQSRKPIAKQFRRWVTSEVLPAIRETGGYAPQKNIDNYKMIVEQWKVKFDSIKSKCNALSIGYEMCKQNYELLKNDYHKLRSFRNEVMDLAFKA